MEKISNTSSQTHRTTIRPSLILLLKGWVRYASAMTQAKDEARWLTTFTSFEIERF
jgi:hypothetical protein